MATNQNNDKPKSVPKPKFFASYRHADISYNQMAESKGGEIELTLTSKIIPQSFFLELFIKSFSHKAEFSRICRHIKIVPGS